MDVDTFADDPAESATTRRKLFAEGGSSVSVRRVNHEDGTLWDVQTAAKAITSDNGEVLGLSIAIMAAAVVTDDDRVRQTVLDEIEMLERLPIAVFVTENGVTTNVNAAALALFGVSSVAEFEDRRRARTHVSPADREAMSRRRSDVERGVTPQNPVEFTVVRPDGTERHVSATSIPSRLSSVRVVVYAVVDMSESHDAHARLEHAAMTDELTGIANRRALLAEIEARHARASTRAHRRRTTYSLGGPTPSRSVTCACRQPVPMCTRTRW